MKCSRNWQRKQERSTLDIYQVSVVGNTCMHHLFLGISPASLVHAPYNPAISQGLTCECRADMGLHIHQKGAAAYAASGYCRVCRAQIPVAAFWRSDRISMNEISLMIDIGTNGEMVLGNKDET